MVTAVSFNRYTANKKNSSVFQMKLLVRSHGLVDNLTLLKLISSIRIWLEILHCGFNVPMVLGDYLEIWVVGNWETMRPMKCEVRGLLPTRS